VSEQDITETDVILAVLESTRGQLGQSVKLTAELEGLLAIERRRNELLRAQITDLQTRAAEDEDKTSL
jgi:hypothetical protein